MGGSPFILAQMKYWVFQNNQVIGPYLPDDLSRLVSFTPESLVCPEGRKGTSMGDWQRAGMVPDLSVALVKSNQRQPARAGLATLAGLPPEPTLKDLAVLGSLQEKVAMLEDVASQLQESLRQKEAELSSVHGALSDKGREAEALRREAEAQKREADEVKRQLAGLEERLSGVNQLSESLDKAVEAEKQVQGDVLKQGETIALLARELEELRKRLDERPAPVAAPAPAPSSFSAPPAPDAGLPPLATPPGFEAPAAGDPPALAPLPSLAPEEPAAAAHVPPPAPADSPDFAIELPSVTPAPAEPAPAVSLSAPVPAPVPTPGSLPSAAPAFDPIMSSEPFAQPLDPLAGASLAPGEAPPAPVADAASTDMMADAKPEPKKGKGKALLVGMLLGIIAVGGGAFYMGLIPGMGPAKPAPEPEPIAAAPEPVPPAAPAPDPRQEAVALAKGWGLTGGGTLGSKLDSVAPASGSLSPWMAESLPDGRVQVNYFASGAAAGSPTIAYEFVVDLVSKSLSGRNSAAKAILTGKTPAPPKPLAVKPVKVRPKKAPAAKPADDESLDSLLGGEDAPAPKAASPAQAKPSAAPKAKKADALPGYDADGAPMGEPPAADSLEPPLDEQPAPKPKAKGRPSRGGKKADEGKASDEALLDDLLQE